MGSSDHIEPIKMSSGTPDPVRNLQVPPNLQQCHPCEVKLAGLGKCQFLVYP